MPVDTVCMTMTTPPLGYIQNLLYPHHYQRETSPLWLTFVCTALGIQGPDITQPYSWCELGCGQGLAALINAAANPLGQFTAVDFNPQHIAHGRALAEAAGIVNLEFIETDFAVLQQRAKAEGPRHDFIILNGVYSWVSPAERQALQACIAAWLKPGGVVFLGYMCQPGMAFMAAAQRFLRCHVEQANGELIQRLGQGLDKLTQMAQAGAGFFQHYPDAADYLRCAREQDLRYLAHELLNAHWESLHVADVFQSMQSCACHYIGSATPLENIDALSLPNNLLMLLDTLCSPAERETFKDLARNQSERRDLYQQGPRSLSSTAHRQALLTQVVTALPGAPTHGGLVFDTRIGSVKGDADLFDPILRELAQTPCCFSELLDLPTLQGQADLINPALQLLMWAGHIHPLLPGEVAVERCQALNRELSQRTLRLGEHYGYLAAPTLGAGLAVDPWQFVAFEVLQEYPSISARLRRETILAILRARGEQRSEAELSAWVAHFETNTLPAWQRMGLVG